MKFKKILAVSLAASMMVSTAIGVSAAGTTTIKEAASGDVIPQDGSADVAIEGIIEPTENTSDDELTPTDPSGTSDVSSGWEDDVVDDTSQLLVTAPTQMKFVVRGNGSDYASASLIGAESVSGTIKNASAYIPADNATVVPKEVEVVVNKVDLNGASEFNLHAKTATQAEMEALSGKKGAVQGLGIQLGSNTVQDFGAAASGTSLGRLTKGARTSDNAVAPSSNSIAFVDDTLNTCFESAEVGRLVNNYTMGLTFRYQK